MELVLVHLPGYRSNCQDLCIHRATEVSFQFETRPQSEAVIEGLSERNDPANTLTHQEPRSKEPGIHECGLQAGTKNRSTYSQGASTGRTVIFRSLMRK